jgi:putative redox protein
MIRTESLPQTYTTRAMSDRHEMIADAPVDKGGGGTGFGAHELLEAALAVCINMAVQVYATACSVRQTLSRHTKFRAVEA